MREIVYADTETTSLVEPWHPEGRRTWEVALIRDHGDDLSALWLQIVDVDLTHANDESLAIGRFAERFSDEHGLRELIGHLPGATTAIHTVGGRSIHALTSWVLQGVTEAEAAVKIDLWTRDAVIAGSRPEFDSANFADILRRHGRLGATQDPRWHHHPLDIANQALGWLRARTTAGGDTGDLPEAAWSQSWREPSYSTATLSEACGVPVPADRHSAWADAAWCYRWDRKLAGLDTPTASPGTRPNGPASRILRG